MYRQFNLFVRLALASAELLSALRAMNASSSPSQALPRCSLRLVWLGWLDWRAERRRQQSDPAECRRRDFRTARRLVGALALLLLLAVVVSQLAPPIARATAHSDTSALPAAAGAAFVFATLLFAMKAVYRAVRFVRQLCERGKAVEARQRGR